MRNLSHLKNSSICIADGTFKVCPKEYLQLYILHGKFFSNVYPLVYILMQTKKEKDYFSAFNTTIEHCNGIFPKYVIIDFEVAAFVAFKKANKNCVIYFCLFHFGQCIWRKLQKLGLSKDFLHNVEFRLFIKCFTSLAFVPVNSVEAEYKKLLKKSFGFKEINLTSFCMYFEKNFLKGTKYPIESWNAYDRIMENIPMTSNSAEIFQTFLCEI